MRQAFVVSRGPIRRVRFDTMALDDPFFSSLRADYHNFPQWFQSKAAEPAWVLFDSAGSVQAFLYLKREDGPMTDVQPALPARRRLKIGTFKVDAHSTRLGQRLLKIALDEAIAADVDEVYATVFPKYEAVVALFQRYGFKTVGTKRTDDGVEVVLLKDFSLVSGHVLQDYPRVVVAGHQSYLLAIYPEFHTRLFPDSILRTESDSVIQDVPYTNGIHKIYLSRDASVSFLRPGDILVIYRTTDGKGPARFRSVVTSLCVVEEVHSVHDFGSWQAFCRYCLPYSVFSAQQLKGWYRQRNTYLIRMTYNVALPKRVTRDVLIREIGLNPDDRWTFVPLAPRQLQRIVELGAVHDRLIVY